MRPDTQGSRRPHPGKIPTLRAIRCLSRIPVRRFLRLLRPVLFIVVLTVAFQVFFSREGATLFRWGFLEVHTGGLWLAFFLALRILLLVGVAGVLSATTAPGAGRSTA